MDANRWQQIEALLEEAYCVSPGRRESVLRALCKGDHELEKEVR